VVSQFYGVFETVTLVGLETREVTSCHASEGEVLDLIAEKTWSEEKGLRKCCTLADSIKNVINS
jgi:hypothetical protein